MKYLTYAAVAILLWLGGYYYGAKHKQVPIQSVLQIDTVWRTDTHFVEKPIPVTRWKDRIVEVPVTDTIIRNDTTYIQLPFERVEYAGDDYKAIVSGFSPTLESIAVFPKTAYITKTEYIHNRWSLGISAGPGLLYDGWGIHSGIGIVAGIQYKF